MISTYLGGRNQKVSQASDESDDSDWLSAMSEAGLELETEIPISTPVCKHHYHMVYNHTKPTQFNCAICKCSLKNKASKTCP